MIGPQKDRHIRVIPTAALDGRDLKWIKVPETKGCHLMTVGSGNTSDPCHYFCAAVKKTVSVRVCSLYQRFTFQILRSFRNKYLDCLI